MFFAWTGFIVLRAIGGGVLILLLAFSSEEERDRFELLYYKYKNLMMKKAAEILRDHMLAEDAVSEAFLRVSRNMHKIDEVESKRTAAFVVTIVRNCARTMLNKRKHEIADDFERDIGDEGELEFNVISEITAADIYRMVGYLDEELREIFLLKFAYDLSHRKIADALGLTENHVAVKLHRAKKRLAGHLREGGYVDGEK